MAHHDRSPDADAAPLTEEELAVFEALASQVGRAERVKARVRAASPHSPMALGALSLLVCGVLVIACAALAPFSVWAAAGCWLLLLLVTMRSVPRWKAMATGVAARLRSLLGGP